MLRPPHGGFNRGKDVQRFIERFAVPEVGVLRSETRAWRRRGSGARASHQRKSRRKVATVHAPERHAHDLELHRHDADASRVGHVVLSPNTSDGSEMLDMA